SATTTDPAPNSAAWLAASRTTRGSRRATARRATRGAATSGPTTSTASSTCTALRNVLTVHSVGAGGPGGAPGARDPPGVLPGTPRWHDRTMTTLVTLDDVRRARHELAGVVRTTPLEPCRPLGAALGGDAWLKCENLQRAGSYKVRGAYVRIGRLSEAER